MPDECATILFSGNFNWENLYFNSETIAWNPKFHRHLNRVKSAEFWSIIDFFLSNNQSCVEHFLKTIRTNFKLETIRTNWNELTILCERKVSLCTDCCSLFWICSMKMTFHMVEIAKECLTGNLWEPNLFSFFIFCNKIDRIVVHGQKDNCKRKTACTFAHWRKKNTHNCCTHRPRIAQIYKMV